MAVEGTSDIYSYCDICCINHAQQNKHIYSKKHKNKLKTILEKFGKKSKEIRSFLQNPVIEDGECKETFWCHFCKTNVDKHVTDHFKTILYGGVLEHFASEQHCDCMQTFWYVNRVDEKLKLTFIVTKCDLDLYKTKLVSLVDRYDATKSKETKKLAFQIKAQEDARKVVQEKDRVQITTSDCVIYRTVKNDFNVLQNPMGYHDGVRVWKGGIVKYNLNSDQIIPSKFNPSKGCNSALGCGKKFIYTVESKCEGLTSVKVTQNNPKGNIHTGAVPPWLRDSAIDSDTYTTNIIGPCQSDFDKHVNQVKKSKLNPNRVGANFNHKSGEDSGWLPSFGRVWNEGARWKSRQQYYKEISGKRKKPN